MWLLIMLISVTLLLVSFVFWWLYKISFNTINRLHIVPMGIIIILAGLLYYVALVKL